MAFFPQTWRAPSVLRATYTALAPLYDALAPRVSRRARATGCAWLDVQDGEHVVDVGTGTGLALRRLAATNPGGRTVGIDLTPAMLRRAHARMGNLPHDRYALHEARATALPFPDAVVDAVFSAYLVDVLPRWLLRPVLREMRRVLRPRGRLVIVHMARPARPLGRLWAGLARFLPPLLGGGRPVALRPVLDACGFRVQARQTRVQAGLRSAIVRAVPRT